MMVSGSSLTEAEIVFSPTGPPSYFSMMVSRNKLNPTTPVAPKRHGRLP